MPELGSHILIHMVDEVAVDSQFLRSRLSWPLHITLVPWFTTPETGDLEREVGAAVSQFEPFDTEMGEVVMLGPDEDIPVTLMADPEPLRAVQTALIKAVKAANGNIESERWTGAAYKPHVTHHGERRLDTGQHEPIDDVHLVRVDADRVCTVVKRFALGAGPAA